MRFKNYANLAKTKNKIPSDNQLAKVLGISGAAIANFGSGKASPSPDTILKLGDLAGLNRQEVVLDFMIDRYSKYPEVKQTLEEIKNLTIKF